MTFMGDTFDSGVCHMVFFADPDGNALSCTIAMRRGRPRDDAPG